MFNSECRFCHSKNLVLVSSASTREFVELFVCDMCLSVYSNPNLQEENVGEFEYEKSKLYVENEVSKMGLNNSSLVMHIGSGDGSLLKLFKAKSIPCFGFEPDIAFATAATARNAKTINDDFGIKHAWELLSASNEISSGQKIDLIVANEIVDKGLETQEVLEAIRLVLQENGSITFIESWILGFDWTQTNSNKTFLSTISLADELKKHDLEIVDIEEIENGSKLMWTVRPKGLFPVSPYVIEMIGREQIAGIDTLEGTIKYLSQ